MAAPTGFTSITASKIQDASGKLLASGRVTFYPVSSLNGAPVSAIAGGGGGMITTTGVTFVVTNGVITGDLNGDAAQLADTTLTTPANIAYRISVTAGDGSEIQGPGYGLVQPSGPSWSLDTHSPIQTLLVTVQAGPQGPQGEVSAAALASAVSQPPRNLFDPSAAIDGELLDATTGNYIAPSPADGNYWTSDYMVVKGGSTIAWFPSGGGFEIGSYANAGIAFYDVNKRYISGIAMGAASNTSTAPVPSSAVFCRMCFDDRAGAMSEVVVLCGASIPGNYVYPGLGLLASQALATAATQAAAAATKAYVDAQLAAVSSVVLTSPDGTQYKLSVANGGALSATQISASAANLIFADTATGSLYRLAVVSGALTVVAYSGSSSATTLLLADSTTATVYSVTVANGALTLTQSTGSGVASVAITDDVTNASHTLTVVNGALTLN